MLLNILKIVVFLCLISVSSLAQDLTPPTPQRIVIKSNILGQDRVVWVRMPAAFRRGRSKYPVVYLLDGDGQINEIGSTIDFLSSHDRLPPMIVVGIGNVDRNHDLTPTHADLKRPDGGIAMAVPTSGGGEKFLDFIQNELFAEIEKRYPTEPLKVFVGHSLGGLMVVHAMNTRPNMFGAYIAVSPTLTWDDSRELKLANSLFTSQAELKKEFFFSMASEANGMSEVTDQLQKILTANAPKAFIWKSARYADEDHGSTVLRAHYDGLQAIFADWHMPRDPASGRPIGGLAGIEKHYRELSDRYGYTVSAEGAINDLGYGLMGSGKKDEAIAVFKRNAELYPESSNVYDSLAT
ncbi:MAG TPA: alpha/beta hydrolase-fold protein, partial [Blastocatellia bacterium]|nr:alpha/beta hydrolase-fold protein [Blastocatellia bacterium]